MSFFYKNKLKRPFLISEVPGLCRMPIKEYEENGFKIKVFPVYYADGYSAIKCKTPKKNKTVDR